MYIRIHIRICSITTRTFLRNTNLLQFRINLKNNFLNVQSLDLSISLQISCSSLRSSHISSSSLPKSDIFSSKVLFTDSNLWTLPSSNKPLTELIILVTKLRWPTLWLMVFWLAMTPLLTNHDGTEWKWNTSDKCCQNDVNSEWTCYYKQELGKPKPIKTINSVKTFSLIIYAEEL